MGRRFTRTDINKVLSETREPDRASGVRCAICPKWGNGWCSVLAKTVRGSMPACSYGKLVIRADKTAEKRGGRKTKPSNV